MFNKIVTCLTLTVICVSSQCNQGCKEYMNSQYTRVKRGKYYPGPPIRFYNQPPMTFPIKGPFSYTPPPFVVDNEPPFPGSRPYKVSKRPPLPSNDGLGDDDIINLMKNLSKQDLDKLLEFAQENNQVYSKDQRVYSTNEYSRPYKRENKIVYKGNVQTKYEEPSPYIDNTKFSNFVTQPTPSFVKVIAAQDSRPIRITSQDKPSHNPVYDNDDESYASYPGYVTSQTASSIPAFNSNGNEAPYVKVFAAQELPNVEDQIGSEKYLPNQRIPNNSENFLANQNLVNSAAPIRFPVSHNPYYSESNEEEKLPPPENMREQDYEVSYTNNIQKVVEAESSSYNIENFGDLPLMEYNSKLHDVSSYHVPHYTVTQPKPPKLPAPPPVSLSSSSSYSSSSTLLKPSPAAAAVKEPIYERAPSAAIAAEQSDAHLKAIKIWSHKSQGAAYTLHDDGSLTPERSRPKYG